MRTNNPTAIRNTFRERVPTMNVAKTRHVKDISTRCSTAKRDYKAGTPKVLKIIRRNRLSKGNALSKVRDDGSHILRKPRSTAVLYTNIYDPVGV